MASPQARMQDVAISTSSSGDTELVAAQADKRIVVHNYVFVAAAAVSVKFKSGSTDKTGAMAVAANGGVAASGTVENRWFATGVGEALNINLSGAVAVAGHVAYTLEPF